LILVAFAGKVWGCPEFGARKEGFVARFASRFASLTLSRRRRFFLLELGKLARPHFRPNASAILQILSLDQVKWNGFTFCGFEAAFRLKDCICPLSATGLTGWHSWFIFVHFSFVGLAYWASLFMPTIYASDCVFANKIFIYFHTQKPLILLTQTGLPNKSVQRMTAAHVICNSGVSESRHR
jgi:hypothetical protein